MAARGEETQDLIANLFKAYHAVPDKRFSIYIEAKENQYDEGDEIGSDKLMDLAMNKYRALVDKELWNAQSEEEKQIVALQAKIEKLEKQGKSKKDNNSKKDSKGKSGSKKNDKPKWMTEPPKQGESTKKTHSNKDYWWCPKHKAWVRHKPEDCKGLGFKPNGNDNKAKESSKEDKPKESGDKKLQLSKALASIVESDEE